MLRHSHSVCFPSVVSRRGGRSKAAAAKEDSEEEDEEEEEEQEDEPTPKVLKVLHESYLGNLGFVKCVEEFISFLSRVFTLLFYFFLL